MSDAQHWKHPLFNQKVKIYREILIFYHKAKVCSIYHPDDLICPTLHIKSPKIQHFCYILKIPIPDSKELETNKLK